MSNRPSVLYVEDMEEHRRNVTFALGKEYEVVTAGDTQDAKQKLKQRRFQAILCDHFLPVETGLDALEWMRRDYPDTPVIMYTVSDDMDTAISAIKRGAYDYVRKDELGFDRLKLSLKQCIERAVVDQQLMNSRFGLIGNSEPMQKLWSQIKRVAPTNLPVLILGETGSGKDRVAEAIYGLSKRADKKLMRVTLSAINSNLISSELFGSVKGAFTGAIDKPGRVRLANGGTLFLDEIGELPTESQSHLNNLLRRSEVEPVGGRGAEKVDIRYIFATYRRVDFESPDPIFKQDFINRLREGAIIHVPPLREHKEDIAELTRYILTVGSAIADFPQRSIEAAAIRRLMDYNWPGNVSELIGVLRRCAVNTDAEEISDQIVAEQLGPEAVAVNSTSDAYRDQFAVWEARYYGELYERCNKNIMQVKELAEQDYTTVHKKLKQYAIHTVRMKSSD